VLKTNLLQRPKRLLALTGLEGLKDISMQTEEVGSAMQLVASGSL
jgi:hypothetical protein